MARALVLAGTSFVGQHLCRLLREKGWEVIASSRRQRSSADEVCDLTSRPQVEALLRRAQPDCVFQCAGATTTNSPDALYRLHVLATLDLLASVAECIPSAPVLLFGSAAEYGQVGPAALPVREDHPPAPRSFFGASKLAQTEAAKQAAAEWGLRILIVRPFNIIGPGMPEHYLAAALLRRLRQAMATGKSGDFLVANGQATRDWIDVRDVAEAVGGLMERAMPEPGSPRVYNIATGVETPVRVIAERLCKRVGNFTVIDAGAGTSRSNVVRSCGDASLLRATTGWEPRISWQQCLDDLWADDLTRGPR